MPKSKIKNRNWRRFRSILVMLVLVASTNIAISYATDNSTEKSGIGINPVAPRPKSGIGINPVAPRPKSGIGINPVAPRPKSGIGINPVAPRP